MSWSRAALVATSVALAGCGTMSTYGYPLASDARPTDHAPVVYEGASLPATTMQEVALIEAVGDGSRATRPDVVRALQAEGARFGADALVRTTIECGAVSCHGYAVAVRFVRRSSN